MTSIFTNIKAPFINDATLRRVMSSVVRDNIFQNILAKPNEAVIEKYSTDTDAAEIQVIRILPDGSKAREIGADKNGGWFNGDEATTPTTAAYGIKIVTTIDRCIDIPTDQQGMMNTDLAEAEMANLIGKVHRNVNGLTFAAQLCKNFNAIAGEVVGGQTLPAKENNWVVLPASDANYKDAIVEALSKLDEGNEDEGIDAYPDDMRAIFIRPSVKAELLKKGQLIIGGSNYAQDILRNGGVDVETNPAVATTGYLGMIGNTPVYAASPMVWTTAEEYLGLAKGTLAGVHALVVSGFGTGRALAFQDATKIIDSPNGQGRRIQPKYRLGAECWDYKSVIPIVASTFSNPAEESNLIVKAPASR
jgi:hypothetical protein